ncbi:MAG: GGDEF domain-containing protein [Bauldia sp.]|nr:GGDEF domain-containing protein [Bauldia sp.]
MALANTLLLVAEALLYFAVFAALFRLRHRFGFGVFVCALGAMHFLETYLAAILYLDFPGGIAFSPGSTILFAGKLSMLLLVYIREDAAAVRQPIYGLLIGNFLMVALVYIMRQHQTLLPLSEAAPDFALMNQMGGMMIWGTILLFIDAIAMILIYERSAHWFGNRMLLRIWVSTALVLSFDQVGFFIVLYVVVDAPVSVLLGGWIGKMAAAVIYSLLTAAYLHWFETRREPARTPRLADVFDMLTYRQRYESLLEKSGRDALTGLFDRGRLDGDGPGWLDGALTGGRSASVLLLDVDHFKGINDGHGHAAGDEVLRRLAARLSATMRGTDRIYRYGGEEFVVLCDGLPHGAALLAADRLRRDVAAADVGLGRGVTISVGVATAPTDTSDFTSLCAAADGRLYQAKSRGRNRVVGRESLRDDRAPSGPETPRGDPATDLGRA